MRRWPVLAALTTAILITASAQAQWTWTPETGRFINMSNLPKETPELQVEYSRSLMIGGDLKKAIEETNKFNEFYSETDYADDNQYLRGEIRLSAGNHVKAAEEFQQVITNHPDSPLYDDVIDSQYMIGDELFEIGRKKYEKQSAGFHPFKPFSRINPFRRRPMKRAIDVYSMVINNQPFTPEAAQAQYKLGSCYFHREEYLEASFEFRRVLEDYPSSEWIQEALFDLTRCYEEAALSPDYDQSPSKLAMSSIAEFNRRFPDDPRVEGRTEVNEEMREQIAEQRFRTAHYYEKRLNGPAARLYYEIVVEEFAGTQAAVKAEQWLAENPPIQRAQATFVGPAVIR